MNNIEQAGIFLNLIIYIILIFPLFLILFKKEIYSNKKAFLLYLVFSIILETFLSSFIYIFPKKIFNLFTDTQGIINFAAYCSRIIFITSSLYCIKILIPIYLIKNHIKKTVILICSKITVNIILAFLGFFFFKFKGILYSIPICDFIYYIIYLSIFKKVFRNC